MKQFEFKLRQFTKPELKSNPTSEPNPNPDPNPVRTTGINFRNMLANIHKSNTKRGCRSCRGTF